MGTKTAATPQQSSDSQKIAKLLDQYTCGRLRFSGTENALYERHLFFDSVIDEAAQPPETDSRRLPGRCATSCPSDGY